MRRHGSLRGLGNDIQALTTTSPHSSFFTSPSNITTLQKRMVAAELRGQVITVYKGMALMLLLPNVKKDSWNE